MGFYPRAQFFLACEGHDAQHTQNYSRFSVFDLFFFLEEPPNAASFRIEHKLW